MPPLPLGSNAVPLRSSPPSDGRSSPGSQTGAPPLDGSLARSRSDLLSSCAVRFSSISSLLFSRGHAPIGREEARYVPALSLDRRPSALDPHANENPAVPLHRGAVVVPVRVLA